MQLLHVLAKTHASFDDPNLVSRAVSLPKCHPCRLCGVLVLVEDAAEAVVSADVEAGGGGRFWDRWGSACSGRVLPIP